MCGGVDPRSKAGSKPDSRVAARALARLMERGLSYDEGHIDPIALRLFIIAYWSRVSKYAHDIHDSEQAGC